MCPLRPGLRRVRTGVLAVPRPLPAGQGRLSQIDGNIWTHLARWHGVQQVIKTKKNNVYNVIIEATSTMMGLPGCRFPDCDEPYPRREDLRKGSEPTDRSSLTVQRDYGFWCPRELKIEPELGYSFMGRKDCSAPCPSMYFSQQEVTFTRYFIGVTSIVCLSATLFTFLTFLIDVTRWVRLLWLWYVPLKVASLINCSFPQQVPIPGATHHLLCCVLCHGVAGVLLGLLVGGHCRVQHSQPHAV